jgi:transcriptional accessory protein Tex/SPT6
LFSSPVSEDAEHIAVLRGFTRKRGIIVSEAADAIKVFAGNTGNPLSQPPVRDARVIAIDPGCRTGCKAALSEHGKPSR